MVAAVAALGASIGSHGSVLSIGSIGRRSAIGSIGSILSVGSVGSERRCSPQGRSPRLHRCTPREPSCAAASLREQVRIRNVGLAASIPTDYKGVGVPASVWIINLVVLGAVLQADLGRRKTSRFRLVRPIVLVAIVMAIFWKGVGSGGDALWFELGLTALGVALGVVAGIIFRLFRGADGVSFSQAGRPMRLSGPQSSLPDWSSLFDLSFVFGDRWLGTIESRPPP